MAALKLVYKRFFFKINKTLRTLLDLSNFILQFVWLFLPVCLSRRLFLVVHRDRKKGRFSRPSRVRHLVDGFWFAVSCHLL